MLALGAWGFKALGDPRAEQVITPDAMTIDLRTAFQPQVAATLPAPPTRRASVPPSCSSACDGSDPRRDPRGRAGRPRLRGGSGHPPAHLRRDSAPERAIATGVVEVLRGAAHPPRPLRDHLPPRGLTRQRLRRLRPAHNWRRSGHLRPVRRAQMSARATVVRSGAGLPRVARARAASAVRRHPLWGCRRGPALANLRPPNAVGAPPALLSGWSARPEAAHIREVVPARRPLHAVFLAQPRLGAPEGAT